MRHIIGSIGLMVAVIGTAPAANSAVITIISEAKTGVVAPTANAASASTDLIAITPHPAWQSNNPLGRGAVWVSNAATGNGDPEHPSIFTNDPNADVIYRVTETFTILHAGRINFSVWADDTARLFFDGGLLKDWNPTQATCANGPIGCQPGEQFTFSQQIAAGTYSIEIDAYQIGGGPFGLLYSGVVAVPTPSTLGLLGLALLGLGFAGQRLTRSNRKMAGMANSVAPC